MIYLLYSQSQKAYHREIGISRIIEDNITQLERGVIADYILVATAFDNDEADRIFPIIKEKIGRPVPSFNFKEIL